MKKILILGAGDYQIPLIERAAKSCEVYVAAPVISERIMNMAEGTLLVDVREKERILDFAREVGVDGVITDQTDIPVRTVAYIAEKMGLPGIGYETGCLFTDKSLMRKKLVEIGVPVLPNKKVFSADEAVDFFKSLGGDVILKPIDTQGSRGIYACCSEEEIRRCFPLASEWSSDKSVIVEKLATGREFFAEGLAFDGGFENLIIGDTIYFSEDGVFAAKERLVPTSADDSLRDKVAELNRRIIEGFGLRQGLTHSEYIMDGEEVYLMETAARGGGVFISSDLISLSTGLDVEEFLLNIATGRQESMPELGHDLCSCGYMAFYVPAGTVRRVSGIEEVRALPYTHRDQLDNLKVGMTVGGGHLDKTTRIALIVSAKDRAQLKERMDGIRRVLHAEVETEDGVRDLIWE